MNVAAGPTLAAAVTNAGGLGVIGGLGYTPKILKQQVNYQSHLPVKFVTTATLTICWIDGHPQRTAAR